MNRVRVTATAQLYRGNTSVAHASACKGKEEESSRYDCNGILSHNTLLLEFVPVSQRSVEGLELAPVL